MAEAMIAGMLRGALVDPGQVVASHPRLERREALEREYGIRTVGHNIEAVDGADVILLGIKPQSSTGSDARSARTSDVASSSCPCWPGRRPPR
jgi:pyrroline-5-carboxylate reductase